MKINALQLARYLILLISALLAVLSIASLTRLGADPEMTGWYAFYSLGMLIESAILLFCYFRLRARSKLLYRLAFVILLLNVVLTVFDQVGFVDILFMLLSLITLGALYLSRKEFLPA